MNLYSGRALESPGKPESKGRTPDTRFVTGGLSTTEVVQGVNGHADTLLTGGHMVGQKVVGARRRAEKGAQEVSGVRGRRGVAVNTRVFSPDAQNAWIGDPF